MTYGEMLLDAYDDLCALGYFLDWNAMAEQMIQSLERVAEGLKAWEKVWR